MIIYFADRRMNILGYGSTSLPDGVAVYGDKKIVAVDSGVASLSFYVSYDVDNREQVEKWSEPGNYLLRKSNDETEFYTIIESENDTKSNEIDIYAEDAGLDLLNEIVGAYEADRAYTAAEYIRLFTSDSGFEIGLNEISDLSRKLKWEGEQTATARVLSVATQFDNAEISYSFEIDGLRIAKKLINIHKKRGKTTQAELRLNRDIDRIKTKKTVANLATALIATGGTPEGQNNPITLNGFAYDDGDFYVSGGMVKSRNALAKWSRYLSETGDGEGHIVQTYSYDTTSQSELCNRTVAALKKICDTEVNFEVDISILPDGAQIGDTVNVVDDAGKLYLSARILQLETSAANNTAVATLGDYLIKGSGISQKLEDLANEFKNIAKNRTLYTWIAYADDAEGSGIALDPEGKAYLGTAVNQLVETVDISDPSVFSWALVKGTDGVSPTVEVEKVGDTTTVVITDAEGEHEAEVKDGAKGDSGIIVSESEPDAPEVGQLWQTADGEPLQTWDGKEWLIHHISADSIEANTLSAISANLGTVTAGDIYSSDGKRMRINVTDGTIRVSNSANSGYTELSLGKMHIRGVVPDVWKMSNASLQSDGLFFSGEDGGVGSIGYVQESTDIHGKKEPADIMVVADSESFRLIETFRDLTRESELLKTMYLLMHPVGDIISTTNPTNPGELWGGSWVAWGTGRVPVGVDTADANFNTANKTGGSSTHTLTIDQIPSHTHNGQDYPTRDAGTDWVGASGTAKKTNRSTMATGGGQAHNNLQPYITCYMWLRTS